MCRETWSTIESHGRKTFSERDVCVEGGVSIDCTKTKLDRRRYRSAEEKVKETTDIR